MRLRRLVLVALLGAALSATSVLAAVSVFATGVVAPETVAQTAAGDFLVTDADDDGPIWSVPAGGGTATQVALAGYSLRDGVFLPASFGSVGGQFLVVGGDTSASASTMDASHTVTLYATQANSLWNTPVVVSGFGQHKGEVLVTNQGSGTGANDGSVDIFTPSGTVGRLTDLPTVNVPFGAAQAPTGFGPVGGTLLVSDADGGAIYSVNPPGRVHLFTMVPLGTGQSGLRQIAFAAGGGAASAALTRRQTQSAMSTTVVRGGTRSDPGPAASSPSTSCGRSHVPRQLPRETTTRPVGGYPGPPDRARSARRPARLRAFIRKA